MESQIAAVKPTSDSHCNTVKFHLTPEMICISSVGRKNDSWASLVSMGYGSDVTGYGVDARGYGVDVRGYGVD
eukprot:213779-Prorocentrum_minimum.AAC.1